MKEMTGLERVLGVLNRETVDTVPVVPQSFMFAAETAGFRIGDMAKDAKLMAKSHIISQDKYGYDGCVIDLDDATLAEACGAKVLFNNPEEPAIVDEHNPLVTDLRQFSDMKLPDPLKDGRLPIWLEATEHLVSEIGDRVFVMGRADQGPFDLLCLLRGTQNVMMELITEEPELIWNALDWCRKAAVRFAKAQKDAGAHATSMGDAYAGPNLISPDMYKQFAWEHEKAYCKEVQDYGIPVSLHICGNTNGIISDMSDTGATILEVDWQLDLKAASEALGGRSILMGNVDPSEPLVIGSPEAVDAKVKEIFDATGGKNVIVSSGCAMGRHTPEANMRALINAARKYSPKN